MEFDQQAFDNLVDKLLAIDVGEPKVKKQGVKVKGEKKKGVICPKKSKT